MDPQKLVEMRRSMEQNNKDYAEYVNGLNNWEDKLKSKKKNPSEIYKDIPQIRSTKKPVPDERISSNDYNKWDKFDADKALDDIDKGSSDVTAEMRSGMLKTQGNEFYKKGDFAQAVSFYTEAIQLVPNNSILLSNRAMALLKLKRFEEAERDCDAAINLDPQALKAYMRRGQARLSCPEKVDAARDDFEKALSLDHGNKMAANFLKQIKLSKMEPGTVLPIEKRARTRQPMVLLSISEVGIAKQSKPIVEKEIEEKVRELSIDSKSDKKKCDHDKTTPPGNNDKIKTEQIVNNSVEWNSPTSSFQFERDWKIAIKDPLNTYNYFKNIEVDKYSTIFGSCLNSDVIVNVVQVLKNYYIKDSLNCFDVLRSLSKVNRFQLTFMFLDNKIKNDIGEIFSYIYNNTTLNNANAKEIDQLKKLYV